MPNGADKNFVRLCAALDGFKTRFGVWPTRVVIHPISLEDIRTNVLAPDAFSRVCAKVDLVGGDAGFRAEGGNGQVYDYGSEGFPDQQPTPSAEEWLGVEPRPGLSY